MNTYLYKITRPIIKTIFTFLYQPTIIGNDNIPNSGSVIIAGNHTSNLDCLLLISSTKRTIHFLAKDDLTKGLKKIIFNNMGIIPVNRKIHDKNALNTAIKIAKEGQVIGIFPEGTINKTTDTIMPFKIGAVKIAHETNSQIVYFTITGKYKLFKKSIRLEFYKPLNIDSNLDKSNKLLMKKLKNELEKRG